MRKTTGHYRAGMPQLSFTGLSENWLLKECGHRHGEARTHRIMRGDAAVAEVSMLPTFVTRGKA